MRPGLRGYTRAVHTNNLTKTPPAEPTELRAIFPIAKSRSVKRETVNGKPGRTFSTSQILLAQVAMPVTIEAEFH